MSRVLVIGATGTIGAATAEQFRSHGDEVVEASRSTSPSVDLSSGDSLSSLFQEIGTVDAVVCATGGSPFVNTADASLDQFRAGLEDKLLNQVNLVLAAQPHLADNGSITLISGILTQHPVSKSVIAGTANGGVEAFVTSAATDLPRGIRINAVSPNVVRQSLAKYGPSFPGFQPVEVGHVAGAFVRSAHGVETGQVFRVW